MPQIFKAAIKESGIAEDCIVTKLRDLNPSHVGVMSKCVITYTYYLQDTN